MAAAPGGPGPDLGSDPGTSSGRPAPPSAPHRFVPAAAGAWCDLCCRFVVSQGLRCAGERPPTPRSLLSRPVPPIPGGGSRASWVGTEQRWPRPAPRGGASGRASAGYFLPLGCAAGKGGHFFHLSEGNFPVLQPSTCQPNAPCFVFGAFAKRKEKVQREKTFPC